VGTVSTDTSSAPTDPSAPTGPAADGQTRYRCAACGNLTRFDVTTSRRTKAFHHYSVGGELSVDEVEVLDETVEAVSCRWCGNGTAVEVIGGSAEQD
jgi:hypothetical protein